MHLQKHYPLLRVTSHSTHGAFPEMSAVWSHRIPRTECLPFTMTMKSQWPYSDWPGTCLLIHSHSPPLPLAPWVSVTMASLRVINQPTTTPSPGLHTCWLVSLDWLSSPPCSPGLLPPFLGSLLNLTCWPPYIQQYPSTHPSTLNSLTPVMPQHVFASLLFLLPS